MSNAQMLSGEFSALIGEFDAQLAIYNTPSSVLTRRVANGLSTRWAFGLTSPAALLVPPKATFATEFLDKHPIGCALRDPGATLDAIRGQGGRWRSTWNSQHVGWSAEGVSERLHEFFSTVAAS